MGALALLAVIGGGLFFGMRSLLGGPVVESIVAQALRPARRKRCP